MRNLVAPALVLAASYSFAGNHSNHAEPHIFMPENDLHLQDNLLGDSNIDEAAFNAIIDSVAKPYRNVISEHGATLEIERDWNDATVNAYAQQIGSVWKVKMFGGLARRAEVTPDGFALVVCHELGHHLGGYAFKGERWAAAEGQSDYFATQACAHAVWSEELEKNAEFRNSVDPVAKAACDEAWETVAGQNLCYRSSMAGLSLATLLAQLGSQGVPSFDTPDTNPVRTTDTAHPKGQCRLDTYFQGALCTQPFDMSLIPGKNHPEGQGSVLAENAASLTSCTKSRGYTMGVRPTCWFSAIQKVSLLKDELTVSEVGGNGNNAWEPGETAEINVPLENSLGMDITDASLTVTSDNQNIIIDTPTVAYPVIPTGEKAMALQPVSAYASPTMQCGANFSLTSTLNFGNYPESVQTDWMLGAYRDYISKNSEPALNIPDRASVEDRIEVQTSYESAQLSVELDIEHTFIGDLIITLVSPQGSEYVLQSREGGRNTEIKKTVEVDANLENVQGTWTLRIEDKANGDEGVLNSWALKVKRLECDSATVFTRL